MPDGVKFLIDLDSRIHGASAADTALARVEASAHGADKAVKHAGHGFDALSSDLFKATVAAHLFEKGMEKATEFAIEGLHKVAELIVDTVNEVAGERREKMALTNLLGGPEAAEEALHYMDRFSELSEFGEQRTKAWGIELLNAGYSGQKWKDSMAAIADAASMAPDKIAGAEEAMASLSRIQLTGKIDARTLRGLRLNVKDVAKDLGDALGMSPQSVQKALREGAIPAARAYEVVLRSLEKKTGKQLGEAGLTAGRGLEAKLTHMRELPEKIMKSVADSPGMEKIEHAFDRLLASFDPEGEKGGKMVQGLSSLMDTVGTFMEETNWDALALSIGGVATSIGKWIDPLSKVLSLLGKVAEGFLALPTLGEDIGDWFARKLHPELNQDPTFLREAREKKTAELQSQNLAAWDEVDKSRGKGSVDLSGAGRSAGGTHIEGKADVTVHVHGGSSASAREIGHAAKQGVEAGLTTALEQQALHAGTRSARRAR